MHRWVCVWGGHARGAGPALWEGSHMARVLVWVPLSLSLELYNLLPLEPTPRVSVLPSVM